MDYLIINVEKPTKTVSRVVQFRVRDRRDTRGGHDTHGDYLEVYRMSSEGSVIGVYPRDGAGFMRAIERIKGQTPRGSNIEVTLNVTYLHSSEILQVVQS